MSTATKSRSQARGAARPTQPIQPAPLTRAAPPHRPWLADTDAGSLPNAPCPAPIPPALLAGLVATENADRARRSGGLAVALAPLGDGELPPGVAWSRPAADLPEPGSVVAPGIAVAPGSGSGGTPPAGRARVICGNQTYWRDPYGRWHCESCRPWLSVSMVRERVFVEVDGGSGSGQQVEGRTFPPAPSADSSEPVEFAGPVALKPTRQEVIAIRRRTPWWVYWLDRAKNCDEASDGGHD